MSLCLEKLLFSAIVPCLLLLPALGLGDEKKTLPIVINDPEWPPYFFGGHPENPPGLIKEILTLCFTRLNIPFEFRNQPIERMQVGMEQGAMDINLFSYKKERENIVQFGKEVFFTSTYRPVVRADSNIEIKSLADFDKYRLGHTIGLRYSKEFYDYVLKRKNARTLDESAREEFNIRKLEAKRIDIFVATESSILYIAKQIGIESKIKVLNFDIQKADYFIAVSKKSPRIADRTAFINQLEGSFRELRKSGEICKITQKYNLPCPRP